MEFVATSLVLVAVEVRETRYGKLENLVADLWILKKGETRQVPFFRLRFS